MCRLLNGSVRSSLVLHEALLIRTEVAQVGAVEDGEAVADAPTSSVLLDLVVLQRQNFSRFSAAADPRSADDLHNLLTDAIRRRGGDEAHIAEYALERTDDDALTTTFVCAPVAKQMIRTAPRLSPYYPGWIVMFIVSSASHRLRSAMKR